MPAPVIDLNADVGERPGPKGSPPTRRSSRRSRASMWPAASMPAMPPRCAPSVPRRSCGTSASAHTCRTWIGRDSADATSTSTPRRCARRSFSRSQRCESKAGLEHGRVGYVKPHGALYNRAAVDRVYADAVVSAIAAVDHHLKLLAPPDSEMLRSAEAHGIEGVAEGFADRAYRPDGTLVPRTEPGAVLTDPGAVLAHAKELAATGRFAHSACTVTRRARRRSRLRYGTV